jgi:hypothetical protein
VVVRATGAKTSAALAVAIKDLSMATTTLDFILVQVEGVVQRIVAPITSSR